MPGTHLNDAERRLEGMWQATSPPYPRLISLHVQGLRGVRELEVVFNYPLVALCGENGSGKSTLLALAALAFGALPGHVPPGAARRPKRGENYSYYTFQDFFFRGPGDGDTTGAAVEWRYAGPLTQIDGRPTPPVIRVEKKSNKWMRYERRPSRAVFFVGAARSVPAVEQRVLRGHFNHRPKSLRRSALDDEHRRRLGEIMGRRYTDAGIVSVPRYALRDCSTGSATYSSFNMGSGEDILVELLHVFQQAPRGALIVIEEVELGLHPGAASRLARHMLEITAEKQLQVVVTTHSPAFLDAVPRKARILIQRMGDVHEAVSSPTTRFAIGQMGAPLEKELYVFCEDQFAARVIGASFDAELRGRVHLIPVGGETQLTQVAGFHVLVGSRPKALLAWDGDVLDTKIYGWLKDLEPAGATISPRVGWCRLPGGVAPEKWVLQQLNSPDGHRALATAINDTPERAERIIEKLNALGDPHDIPRYCASEANLPEDEAAQALVLALRDLPDRPLETVSEQVREALNGMLPREPNRSTAR